MHLNRDDMEGNRVLNLKPKLSARSDVEIKSIFHGRFGSSKLLNFKPKMHYILRRKLKEHLKWASGSFLLITHLKLLELTHVPKLSQLEHAHLEAEDSKAVVENVTSGCLFCALVFKA